MKPRIIFESDELLVLDKPAGLIVHSDGRTEEPSVAEWLITHFPTQQRVGESWVSPQGEVIPLAGIVHRLDRTTSGVLLVAKTNDMYAYLKQQFKEKKIEKTYHAYVYGHMQEKEGEIVAEIVRSDEKPKRWYARPTTKDDKRAAITKWKLIKKITDLQTGDPASLLEIHPKTGRTHQIRVHLASIGHAIIADHLYASSKARLLAFNRPALHASEISLALSSDDQRIFIAPLPNDFRRS